MATLPITKYCEKEIIELAHRSLCQVKNNNAIWAEMDMDRQRQRDVIERPSSARQYYKYIRKNDNRGISDIILIFGRTCVRIEGVEKIASVR